MNNNEISFIGYHGTSAEIWNKIKEGSFKKSHGGWIGEGVYFYEDDNEMALEWARYKYPLKRITNIECSIIVLENKVLDTSNPKNEANKKIQILRKELFRKGIKEKRLIDLKDEEIDCKIINLICSKDGYDVVRNFTYTFKDFDRENKRKSRSNIPNGIELCVRNVKCIIIKK